jgi:hypothetical protein
MKNGFFSLLEGAAKFTAFAENIKIAKQITIAEIAIMVRDEAKAALGTYKYRWPHLSESTQEERVKEGFPEDEPGLRTGAMRESIEAKIFADEERAYVGSNNDKLVWFELGTKSQPPRSVLMAAAMKKEREAHAIAKRNIRRAWLSAGHSHELMQALHLLKLLIDTAKDVVKDFKKSSKEK